MNKWLIQVVSRNDMVIENEVSTLNKLGYKWDGFGVIELLTLMTNIENILTSPNDSYIIRGGTKILQLLDNIVLLEELSENLSHEQKQLNAVYLQKLREGIFYNVDNFDQKIYGKLDLPLLNNDVEYYSLADVNNLKLTFDELKFVKPSRDLKAFNAGLLEPNQTVWDFISNQMYQPMYKDEELLVSSPKNVWDEYRFFVLGDEVITGSQYRNNKQLKPSPLNNSAEHQKVLSIAREYAKLYQPAEIFTLDIGKHDSGYSIVEYNCFNASGLYQSDVEKLFKALQSYVENKNNTIKYKAKV
jgi:hypothetical protein